MTWRIGTLGFGLLAAAGFAVPAHAAAEPLGEDRAACLNGGPAIEVNLTGWKDRAGEIKLELYPGAQEDFLKDDRDLRKEGKFFRRVAVPVPPSGPVSLCIKAPHPGRFGLFVTHNRDGRNAFSIWQDGAGIASNRKIGRGKPRLEASTVEVPAGVAVLNIQLQYLRGLAFGPIRGKE